jgi:Uma2 family endonuclease
MIATKNRLGDGVTFNVGGFSVEVPDQARTLSGFRAWALGGEVPEKARVDFYRGKVWVEMGSEQIFTHAILKTRISTALDTLIEDEELGFYSCNGVLLTNDESGLSVNPDGCFVSSKSLESEHVTLKEGAEGGYTELIGTPDMVLEVVSPGSVSKDKKELRQAYWEAGIPEYWLVDCRDDRMEFLILKSTAKGYSEARKVSGWTRSEAFKRSFRLTRKLARDGTPRFKLEIR